MGKVLVYTLRGPVRETGGLSRVYIHFSLRHEVSKTKVDSHQEPLGVLRTPTKRRLRFWLVPGGQEARLYQVSPYMDWTVTSFQPLTAWLLLRSPWHLLVQLDACSVYTVASESLVSLLPRYSVLQSDARFFFFLAQPDLHFIFGHFRTTFVELLTVAKVRRWSMCARRRASFQTASSSLSALNVTGPSYYAAVPAECSVKEQFKSCFCKDPPLVLVLRLWIVVFSTKTAAWSM